jgi:hypothetical protein
MMKEMGYHTAQIGKWHLGWGDNDGKTDFAADELPRGPREAFVAAHRAWWKTYYPAGFVPIPHPAMVSFYWIQIYKLGSCIRKGGPMCDLMGPWYKDTRWPAIWWNLNTQMLYSPFPVANRLEMAENLSDMLLKHRANLIANVPDPSQRVGLAATLRGEALRLPRLHRSGTSNAAVTCVTLAGKDETWNY